MRVWIRLFCFLFVMVLASQVPAHAKSVVFMPFSVNGPKDMAYLGKAVPASIKSKLTGLDLRDGKGKAGSAADAKKAIAGADHVVWGNINVLGNECTVELNALDKSGKTWQKSFSGTRENLSSTVQKAAMALGGEALGTAVSGRPGFGGTTTGSGRKMGGDIVVNETGKQEYYLNPQLRYQGAGAGDGSRIRSQRLKYNMVDMAVADFNGDGKNEIAIIDDHNLYINVWDADGRLKELAKIKVSQTNQNFSMRAIDLNGDRARELVIATYEERDNRPQSYFFTFRNGKLAQFADRCPYFVSVIRTPPSFQPTLVGQNWDSLKLFAPGVHQMIKEGNKYKLGGRLSMPSGANVFNVAWIPAGRDSKSDQLVLLTDDERIKLFQGNTHTEIHKTMERFSGSATGMDFYKGMPGLGINKTSQEASKYYAPMRMIAADIGRTGEYVLLLNKPISTASQFFDRYRFFPQGEVHALYWDGVGLGLKWKTRRIRGSVAEVDLADVNNDGILDLVVGLNSSPDLGIGSRQCMVTAYPLDVSRTNPNAPADMSDFEVNPNN